VRWKEISLACRVFPDVILNDTKHDVDQVMSYQDLDLALHTIKDFGVTIYVEMI
jgi:hypothetical protein